MSSATGPAGTWGTGERVQTQVGPIDANAPVRVLSDGDNAGGSSAGGSGEELSARSITSLPWLNVPFT